MKYNKILIAVAMLLVGVTFSCTDKWDDHYEVKTLGDGTLWEAITSEESLSNFAAVLEATGYKGSLNGSQVFTVFAPTNASFTETDRDAAIQSYNAQKAQGVKDERNTVIKELVQNHIALYNYSVSSVTGDTVINMMNGKYVAFNSTTFSAQGFEKYNVATENGVLFIISGKAAFEPNILEYLEKDAELDSLRAFIYKYNLDVFQAEQSVPGDIVDGKQQYLDSVTVLSNEILYGWLDAQLDEEDSSYVMLAPTNTVWDQLLTEYSKYYTYDPQVVDRDSFEYNFPRMAILQGTVFSQNTNRGIAANQAIDSVMSTNAVSYSMRKYIYGSYDRKYYQYDNPYAEGGIFAQTSDVECSNGIVKKTNIWNINAKETFLREIVMEGESNRTLDSLNVYHRTNNPKGNTSSPKYVNVSPDNPFYDKVSNNGYMEIMPSGVSAFSKASFYVRDVLSNVPYDVYVVLVPATAGDTLASEELLKTTRIRVAMQCHDADGNAVYVSPDEAGMSEPVFKNNITTGTPEEPSKNTRVDISDICGTELDSVFVGTYTFPTSSYGTSEPQVKLFLTSRGNSTYSKILRLDCIVLKPHVEE